MGQLDEFELWLRSVSPYGGEIDPAWLRWLRRVYEEAGPMARADLDVLAQHRVNATFVAAPWTRLGNDVRSTTGRVLQLDLDHGAGLVCHVTLDGNHLGSVGRSWCLADPEVLLAELAEDLQEHSLHEAIWGGWPTCPRHHTHPLEPKVVDEIASWMCLTDDEVIAAIGELTSVG